MATIHELQGFAIALDKVLFVSQVFPAKDDEGYQFNVCFAADMLLKPRFATRHEAELARGLLLKAMRGD